MLLKLVSFKWPYYLDIFCGIFHSKKEPVNDYYNFKRQIAGFNDHYNWGLAMFRKTPNHEKHIKYISTVYMNAFSNDSALLVLKSQL